jgi:NADPH2:quinone reductase
MQVVLVQQPGGPEQLVLAHMPQPIPAKREVLIKVHSAGVNRPDILQRRGLYVPPVGASPILGLEVAGTVAAVGSEAKHLWTLHQPVMALCNGGGYAEYVAVPAGQCMDIPQNISFSQAASLPEVYMTVWQNLQAMYPIQPGQAVLIHAAASGVGSAAIMFCKRRGAKVFVTVSTPEKAEFCAALGADHVFLHADPWEHQILSLTQGQGVARVLDMVAGLYVSRNLVALSKGGVINIIAFLGGRSANLDVFLLMQKQAILTGATLRSQPNSLKKEWAQALEKDLGAGFVSGEYRSVVRAEYPLADVVKAHQHLETSVWMGKMVLNVII